MGRVDEPCSGLGVDGADGADGVDGAQDEAVRIAPSPDLRSTWTCLGQVLASQAQSNFSDARLGLNFDLTWPIPSKSSGSPGSRMLDLSPTWI